MASLTKKKQMSTAKLVTLITLASLLFVVLSFGAYAFIVTKANELSEQFTEQSVNAARSEYEAAGGIARLKTLNTLQESKIVHLRDGNNYASRFDTCSLASDSVGWTATTWYQSCHMRYVDLLETGSSLQDVRAKLTKNNSVVEEDSEANREASACTPLKMKMGDTTALVVYVPAGKLEKMPEKNSADHLCALPSQANVEFKDDEQTVKEKDFITKKYYSFDSSQIDTSKAYIYTVRDGEYYRGDVGCSGLVLCEQPNQEHITGF
jgi:hypothetical protein